MQDIDSIEVFFPFVKNPLIIDIGNYNLIHKHKWTIYENRLRYIPQPFINGKSPVITIYGLIMKGDYVDHKNGNPMDNRRKNLRFASQTENGRNRRKQKSKTSSKYKGVCWNKQMNKWRSYIRIDGRLKHIAYHINEDEAGRFYDREAIKHFGKFARLNLC